MNKRSAEIQVGIFVTSAIAICIIALLSLEDGGVSFFRDRYQINLKARSVEGLGPGSVIQLLGVPIGNVKKIKLIPEKSNEVLVVLNIYKEFQSMIPVDSRAYIKSQGALGDMFVLIRPGNNHGEVLKDEDFIELGTPTGILAALSEDNSPLDKLSDILTGIKVLLERVSSEEEDDNILSNLEEVTMELKTLLANINKILDGTTKDELKSLLADLSSVVNKIERGQGTLGAIINDSTIHSRIKALLGGSKADMYVHDIVRQSIKNPSE